MFKKIMNVKSILFDMDGVITNTMPDHFRSWKEALKAEGICVSYEDIYRREGQPGLSSVHEIFAEYDKPMDDQEAARILENKENVFNKIVRERFIPGARNFLKYVHKKNIRMGLVTGTSRRELLKMLPEKLRRLFSAIVTGDEVENGKPHPEPYRRCLDLLGIHPREAVVIENAPYGIQSAKAAGIVCFALETSLPKVYLSDADAVFSSIRELQDGLDFQPVSSKDYEGLSGIPVTI